MKESSWWTCLNIAGNLPNKYIQTTHKVSTVWLPPDFCMDRGPKITPPSPFLLVSNLLQNAVLATTVPFNKPDIRPFPQIFTSPPRQDKIEAAFSTSHFGEANSRVSSLKDVRPLWVAFPSGESRNPSLLPPKSGRGMILGVLVHENVNWGYMGCLVPYHLRNPSWQVRAVRTSQNSCTFSRSWWETIHSWAPKLHEMALKWLESGFLSHTGPCAAGWNHPVHPGDLCWDESSHHNQIGK